jgi:hypothetical protein
MSLALLMHMMNELESTMSNQIIGDQDAVRRTSSNRIDSEPHNPLQTVKQTENTSIISGFPNHVLDVQPLKENTPTMVENATTGGLFGYLSTFNNVMVFGDNVNVKNIITTMFKK